MELVGPWGELRIEQDVIEVSVMVEPDPDWRYTDQQGHKHAYVPGEEDHYPTLVTVLEEPYWCPDCHDEHQDSHHECVICGEEIVPGSRVPPGPTYMPGMKQAFLNDEPISGEHADEILEQARRMAEERQEAGS